MTLEACIICLDNSDWTRNGDYHPTRWEAQIQAANIITENKSDKNPENCLGVISMAGKRVETPVTLTTDEGKILKSIKDISLNGECDFITACNIAMLILKHRQNKNQKQRILMFIASPIKHKNDDLVILGKKLKKNNVALDIISYGNTEQNKEAVNLLINTVNNSNNSHLLEVEQDQYIVDCLFTSPILNDFNDQQPNDIPSGSVPVNNPVPQNNMGGGLSQFERDINLAIQQSMEEEDRRKVVEVKPNTQQQPQQEMIEEEEEDIEKQLEEARLLSIQEHEEALKREKEKEANLKNELIKDDDFMNELLNDVGLDQSQIKDVKNEFKDKNDDDNQENEDDKLIPKEKKEK